tara:strand:+ start:32 stop:1183 length:1152 start_codon:yes stop_codon:yes gene_type:complete
MNNVNKLFNLALAFLIISCSGGDDSSPSTPPDNGGGDDSITEITLNFNKTVYNTNEAGFFTVRDQSDNLVTDLVSVFVNGDLVEVNPFVFQEEGTYDFVATYENLTSNTVSFDVETPSEFSDTFNFTPSIAPSNFTKKVLLEETTGTWCVSCPTGAFYMSQAIESNPNIFGAAYHSGIGSYPDPMSIPETDYWHAYYNAYIFPTIFVNGAHEDWNYPNMNQINSELSTTASLGLAIDAAIIGGKLDIEVKVGFNSTPADELQLMIILIEGSDTAPSSPQVGSNDGPNYVHKYIVRDVYSDILGDVIPASNTLSGGVYTRTITGLDLPTNINTSDYDDISIIAYVKNSYQQTFTNSAGDTFVDSPFYDIYNIQQVQVGEIAPFD